MPRSAGRPSIRDVAKAAGVSHQTVSRVLNAPELVRPGTRQRVEEVINRLGYRRSRAARSLATNDSRAIGIVAVQAALFGPSEMAFAIDEGARDRSYSTVRITLRDDSLASLDVAREHLQDLAVDGLIVLAWSGPSLGLAQSFAGSLPTCVVAEGLVPDGIARVRGDHRGAAEAATKVLIQSGCRHIGHLAGPSDWLEARARLEGWRSAANGPCLEAGWHAADGYRAMGELWALDDTIDGIVAANDHVAVGAMKWLTERGIDVPGRVAVFGFDDVDVAGYLRVPLASVRQPFHEVGEAALQALFTLMDGGQPVDLTIPAQLVVRESAGVPPIS